MFISVPILYTIMCMSFIKKVLYNVESSICNLLIG